MLHRQTRTFFNIRKTTFNIRKTTFNIALAKQSDKFFYSK